MPLNYLLSSWKTGVTIGNYVFMDPYFGASNFMIFSTVLSIMRDL
jgi:hypothetical protein